MQDKTLRAVGYAAAHNKREIKRLYRRAFPAAERAPWRYFLRAGEAAQIIKKEGDRPILDCPETRAHFVEELCDVYMYLASTAMCYGITPQELAQTFVEKHRRNMQRW